MTICNSLYNSFFLDLSEFGWKRVNEILYPVWDTDVNVQVINEKVKRLTSGCKCKKGCTGRCGCRKAGHECGPGCSCINCTNKQIIETVNEVHTNNIVGQEQERLDNEDGDDNEEYEYIDEYHDENINDYYEQLEQDVDDIMDQIFNS